MKADSDLHAGIVWQESERVLYTLCNQESNPNIFRRLQTMCLLRQGKSIKEAAWIADVQPRTVSKWLQWYRQDGIDALRNRRAGRFRRHRLARKTIPKDRADHLLRPSLKSSLPQQVSPDKPVEVTYQFKPGESVEQGVKRIITEKIDQALWQLTEYPDGRDKGVHKARKCLKRIRATLRLVRDEMGYEIYKRENICYRDAGRLLAPVRESAVLISTLDKITERFAEQLVPGTFEGLRQKLVVNRQVVCEQILEQTNAVDDVVAVLQQARERTQGLPIETNDFIAMRDGLRRVYRRGRNRLTDAYKSPAIEVFHDWRKRIKYLWYQSCILHPVWPSQFGSHAAMLSQISDWLGEDHDLSELQLFLANHPLMFDSDEQIRILFSLADSWSQEYRAIAHPLGRRIYVEPPRVFSRRVGRYWKIWHAETN